MTEFPVLEKLSDAHSREIGHIVTRWAFLEWRLKNVAYRLLRVDQKEGRLAVREMRADDYLTMIEDLIKLNDLPIDFDFKKYKKVLSNLESYRNLLAHGIWINHPKHRSPVLRRTKGNWKPDSKNPKLKLKRVLNPEGVEVSVTELRQFGPLIGKAARAAAGLEVAVGRAIASSLQKSK